MVLSELNSTNNHIVSVDVRSTSDQVKSLERMAYGSRVFVALVCTAPVKNFDYHFLLLPEKLWCYSQDPKGTDGNVDVRTEQNMVTKNAVEVQSRFIHRDIVGVVTSE